MTAHLRFGNVAPILPEELVFILGFLALFGIPVLGVLAWGIWVVYDNEREEPPAGRGVTG